MNVVRRRRVLLPVLSAVAAGVVLLSGWLPRDAAVDLLHQTGPVLLFVVAITAFSELCAVCGLFDAAAGVAVRAAAGRRLLLWLWVAAIATACTVVLSLDTTAVLLTPVVLAMARRTGSAPLPLALTVLALANTASLLLPVSNLTNLLAAPSLEDGGAAYVATMAWPAVAVLTVTLVALGLLHRRGITGRLSPGADVAPRPDDPLLLRCSAVVTAAVVAGFAAGLDVALVASAGALVLGALVLARRRSLVVRAADLVPWKLAVTVAGLFVVVAGAHAHGLDDLAGRVAGTGTGGGALAQLAAVATVTANAINNLPAYLALEPVAIGDPLRTAVLLVAVNAGPLVAPWGSLATLLWWRQVRRHGRPDEQPTWRLVVGQGLLIAPLAVAAGTATAALTLG
ncbi:SLC13 family permease [Mumia sp. DW29H23]|uniref:SLC13 family permease n=1 Tax=Mumia sp. DW29H23 TaxID=3421241 RepID=UPI003D68C291